VRQRHLWISTLLLLLILARLMISWPDRSLWYDETVNAYFAERSWGDIWEWNTQIDNQVPLHFVLLKLWGGIAGTSEFALRAFSFWCAVLTTAGTIALGKRLGGTIWAGWLAALALALSQSFLYAAFEVRTYGLALTLFVWSSVILWELWERHANEKPFGRGYYTLLAVYLLLALGLVYSHYTGFLALAVHGVYLGWRVLLHPSQQRANILLHIGIGVILGYLPWVLALAGRDVRAGTAYGGRVKPGVALETYLAFYAHGQRIVPENSANYMLSIAVLVITALLLVLLFYRHRPKGLGFAVLATFVPLIGLVVMVYAVQGKLSGRHGWPAWLGASLIIGLGLASLVRFRWLRWPLWAAALLVIWLPASASLKPIYDSQLREAFAYINTHAEPGDALILRDGTLFTAAGYYDNKLPWIGLPPEKLLDVNRFLFYDEAFTQVTELIDRADARRVWIVAWQGHIMDPQDLADGILEYIGDPQPIERPFGDVIVSLYALHDQPLALAEKVGSLEPVLTVPAGGPTYFGGYVLDETVPHGGVVQMQTWWQRGDSVLHDMRVSVRLYGSDGIVYAQLDMPPVAWSFGQEHWKYDSPILSRFALWVPYEIPSGQVEIKMVIYDMRGAFDPITVPVATFEVRG
jgi:hypothetical protein